MAINDTAVHDIDVVRWLLDDEIVGHHGPHAAPQQPRPATCATRSFVLLEMASGALVDVEVSVNIAYGYDIRGEIVGRDRRGERSPRATPWSSSARARFSGRVPDDWRERFVRAYDVEFQEWLDAVAGRHRHRPERLGRLRRHRRLRRRAGGAAHRDPPDGGAARAPGALRSLRTVPTPPG